MDEIECTAIGDEGDGDVRRHLLYTPPCACPNCAPDPVSRRRPDRNWLKVAGMAQRQRVELVDLGTVGRHVLG